MKTRSDGFLWGVATSAQQIEGGRSESGRGDSVWDHFASMPGTIEDGSNPFTACDHYHRWSEDVDHMAWLGLNAYRFSTGWSRIMPEGRGRPNEPGLDFYDALVDTLLAKGILPFITLNHWDMPQALDEDGGWGSRETVGAFLQYAEAVTKRLGDRVKHWTTHNEPWCIASLGHEEGCHAPGRRDPEEALRVAHHLLLSHGRALHVMRANSENSKVGIVLNLSPAWPVTDGDADRDAARNFDGLFNRWYLDPLFRGAYPEDAVNDRVRRGHLRDGELPFVRRGDMEAIATPMDFLGVNYYSRTGIKAGPDGEPVGVPMVPRDELTEMGWEIFPDGLEQTLRRVHEDYSPSEMYVTESGIALPDPRPVDGRIDDQRRIAFLRDHMAAAERAIAAGVPLRGYFVWSLMDNYEWQHGYTKRFGLFHVDFDTCERVPKESAHWYRSVLAAHSAGDAG